MSNKLLLITKGLRLYRDGEPCTHRGCQNHVSHPCECCNRISANGEAWIKEKIVKK